MIARLRRYKNIPNYCSFPEIIQTRLGLAHQLNTFSKHSTRYFCREKPQLTIIAPIPIVANLALSSVRPELMKSDVE